MFFFLEKIVIIGYIHSHSYIMFLFCRYLQYLHNHFFSFTNNLSCYSNTSLLYILHNNNSHPLCRELKGLNFTFLAETKEQTASVYNLFRFSGKVVRVEGLGVGGVMQWRGNTKH